MRTLQRFAGITLTAALLVVAAASPAGAQTQAGFVPPWKFQFSLSPPYGPSGLPLAISGLEVISPDNGGSETLLGLAAEFGYLATPYLEPSLAVSLTRLSTAGSAITQASIVPSLKINYFTSPHVCLFLQPFAGIMVLDAASTNAFSDIGVWGGIEGLVSSWGIRLFTGIEWAHGDFSATNSNVIGFPIRWALFAYF